MEDNFSCKIVFLTFADKRFINLLRRTEKESMAFPFAKRYFLTDEDCYVLVCTEEDLDIGDGSRLLSNNV